MTNNQREALAQRLFETPIGFPLSPQQIDALADAVLAWFATRPSAPTVTTEQARQATEAVAVHTPDLVHIAPDHVSDGQHLYCVECGVLPIDGLGFQYGPEHVIEKVLAALGIEVQP